MFTVKKSSWHYRMVLRSGAFWPPEDICRYRLRVIEGTLVFAMCVALTSFIAIWNLFGLWFAFAGGWAEADMFTAMNVFTLGAIAIIGTCIALVKINKWRNRMEYDKALAQTQPSLISAWYRSVKDRVCTPIEYID